MAVIIYSDIQKIHHPKYEYSREEAMPHFDSPERVSLVAAGLRTVKPKKFSLEHIHRVHNKNYIDFIRRKSNSTKADYYPLFDTKNKDYFKDNYTPVLRETWRAAVEAVNIALTGACLVINGEKSVYCLARPPGHHAGNNYCAGYCYLNNAAIAANYLRRHGSVAILDLDFHHGNGTQEIFYNSKTLFVSIHANPKRKFPYYSGYRNEIGNGRGKGCNYNFPLPEGIDDSEYLKVLSNALKIITNYKPSYLVLSMGFDTYKNDPLGDFNLTAEAYRGIARKIIALGIPLLVVHEGGYCIEKIPLLVRNFLEGLRNE